jgi:hypothetical protein
MATVTSMTAAHIQALIDAANTSIASNTTALASKADLVSGKVPDTQIASNVVRVDSLTLNVQNHGAVGDGTTDDTAAIQAVLDGCPAGGTVYLPKTYAVTTPLKIPPQVRIKGQHGSHLNTLSLPTIKAKSTFTGSSVLLMVDQATGGTGGAYSILSTEQRVENLTIDMSAVPGATYSHGISALGYVYGVRIKDVGIYNPTGYGLFFTSNGSGYAQAWHTVRLNVVSPRDHGILASMFDATWTDCLVSGGAFSGWIVGGSSNSTFDTCRAEKNANNGFFLNGSSGSGNTSGGPTFIGCSTDRNANNGVLISSGVTGNGVITFVGCSFRRDGSGSTSAGYAGLNINAAASPVIVSACKSYPGVDDAGTGNATPQYGVSVTSATSVQLDGGIWHAISEGVHDGGSNTRFSRGLNVFERTGTTASPATVTRGVQTYGSVGDSLYVPGNLAGEATPANHGAIAWTADPSITTYTVAATNGTLFLSAVYIPNPVTAIKIWWKIATAGATPTAGQNFVGLYNSSGTRLASVGVDGRITTAGLYSETISVALTPGWYWVGFLLNSATPPQLRSSTGGVAADAAWINFNLTAAQSRYAINGTGLTALPATITPSSNSQSSYAIWAALS